MFKTCLKVTSISHNNKKNVQNQNFICKQKWLPYFFALDLYTSKVTKCIFLSTFAEKETNKQYLMLYVTACINILANDTIISNLFYIRNLKIEKTWCKNETKLPQLLLLLSYDSLVSLHVFAVLMRVTWYLKYHVIFHVVFWLITNVVDFILYIYVHLNERL